MWGVLSKFFPGGPLLPRSFQEALEACPGVVTRGIVGTHGCLELRERRDQELLQAGCIPEASLVMGVGGVLV